MALGRLVVLPNLKATVLPNGRLVLTKKFVEGMQAYVDQWDGPVEMIIERAESRSDNLDNIEVSPSELPFRAEVAEFDEPDMGERMAGAAVVLGGVSDRQNHLGSLCQSIHTPLVFGTEYTLKTRLQVVRAEVANPLRAARRAVWELNQERRQRGAMRLCQGLQCNGTPTYDAYKNLTRRSLLFFDTRVDSNMVIEEERLEARLEQLRHAEPLRLAFSGRLNKMKGADHLPAVARHLRELQVPFELSICGGGAVEEQIRGDVERWGLADQVQLKGVLDFETELVPFVQSSVDLFVCCHRQGDPSCTYLETFSCGVPIVGYDNEAFTGLLARAPVGRATPMDHPRRLAQAIRDLHEDRQTLQRWSRSAVQFARRNTFDIAFRRRIDHLASIAVNRPS